MSGTVNDVIDAMVDTVRAETGLVVHGIVDSPVMPCVMVYPGDDIGGTHYFNAFARGSFELPVVLSVITAANDIVTGQRWLNDVISPFGRTSIVRALFENATLGSDPDEHPGGAAARFVARVTRVADYGLGELYLQGPRVLAAKVHATVTVTLRNEEQ